MASMLPFGNVRLMAIINVTLTPALVSANTSAEQDFTVTGLLVGDHVSISAPSLTAGSGIVGVRVKAADTLSISWGNFTSSNKTPPSGTYTLCVRRPDGTPPSNIAL